MRFLVDMPLSPRIALWLRQRRHDAIHRREERLERLADIDVFRKAIRESRIFVTRDLDFSEIVALSGHANASVVILRLFNPTHDRVVVGLARVIDECAASLAEGAVITIEESRYRVRRLPLLRL